METPYRKLIGAATVAGVFDNIDYRNPKAFLRVHQALKHVQREIELRSMMYMQSRMLSLLQVAVQLPQSVGVTELVKIEAKLDESIQQLLMGKKMKHSPAKLAKKWREAWNKEFGDQDDPAVQKKIESAAAAMMRR